MIYKEHLSQPGYGYIEPIMDRDDPLIPRYIAERIIERYSSEHEVLRKAVDWWVKHGKYNYLGAPAWVFAARELLEEN